VNILIANTKSGAFFEIATGWKNAFKAGGHQAALWDGTERTWKKYRPDIYIACSSWESKRSLVALRRLHNTKLVVHVDPYSKEKIQVPGGPPIGARQEHIKWTVRQEPDFVFGYGLQEDMERYWIHWRQKHGLKIVGMPNAADSTIYKPRPADPNLACEIGWVGGYWKYKALNMDKYLIPVVRTLDTVWFGWSGPKGIWNGKASQEQVIRLFNSAKVCPCIVEPHTTRYGIDVPERMFKVSACGALAVLDPFIGVERYFSKDSIVMARSPQEYLDLCKKYVAMKKEERRAQAKKMQKAVLLKHTYLNRVQTFLNQLGFSDEANKYDSFITSQVPD
jgi:hypothetical protein